ncbi:DUF1848 domain-containing protein [Fundidesulfovibrio agrisoli]|uniref:DUF1848 domain-containing protein n=1 Tax=Fundidesulfovibrio agrisoli TaxID=2922717 RepID=UPI001FAD4833
MIVSATRRADLPAHYAAWFLERARAGWCAVPNPFNARQVSRVSLAARDVEAVVFWTRDPRPMIPHLAELDRLGLPSVFQFTLLEYPASIHPGMLPLAERIEAFRRLAGEIGPDRVLWRYDPILLCASAGPDYHLRMFEALCRKLEGCTRRVTVSLMEPYRKARRRLAAAGVDMLAPDEDALGAMFNDMAAMARAVGMEPASCADEAGLDELGFVPGACIDAALIKRLFGVDATTGKDASQRPACRCAPSRDIGMYDACQAGCAYCYATRDFALARRNRAAHDPASPSMLGRWEPEEDRPRLPGI